MKRQVRGRERNGQGKQDLGEREKRGEVGSERNGVRIGERVGGKEGEKYREANIIIIAIGQLALAAVYSECTWN